MSFFALKIFSQRQNGGKKNQYSADKQKYRRYGNFLTVYTLYGESVNGVVGIFKGKGVFVSVDFGRGLLFAQYSKVLDLRSSVVRRGVADRANAEFRNGRRYIHGIETTAHIKGTVTQSSNRVADRDRGKRGAAAKAEIANFRCILRYFYAFETCAASETGFGQSCDIVGEVGGGKGFAAAEAAHAKLRDRIGNGNALKGKTGVKGVVTDFFDCIGQSDMPESSAFIESVVAYFRDPTAFDSLGYLDVDGFALKAGNSRFVVYYSVDVAGFVFIGGGRSEGRSFHMNVK